VVAAARVIARHLDERLQRVGLSISRLAILGHLRRQPGLSIAELARRSHITPQSMHSRVHDLLAAGMLQTDEPLRRGRAGPLRLSPAGEDALVAARAVIAEVDKELGIEGLDISGLARAARGASGASA
jgi:DNA-binding MarR family transcriptional regulator